MPNRKKRNRKYQERSDSSVWNQFCRNTSMHGLKYIAEQERSRIERVVWVFLFLLGVSVSMYFCWQMWTKWDESPTIIVLNSHHHSLKSLSFPAITICNVNKVSKKRLEQQLTSPKYRNVSYDDMHQTLRYLTKLDRGLNKHQELQQLQSFYQSQNISITDLVNILIESAPSLNDTVMDCMWGGSSDFCMQYFSFLPTDDGICCTFNGANYSDPQLGIEFRSISMEPLRVSNNGYIMGVSVVLNANIEDYSITTSKFNGFKVLLHSPEDFADVSNRGFVIGPGSETFVSVRPTSMMSTDQVASVLSFERRGCYVPGERQLKHFKHYSRTACVIECTTNRMLELCQCRPFFFRADKETQLCDLDKFNCIAQIYAEVRADEEKFCHCPPSCSGVWYVPEISAAPFPGYGFSQSRTFDRLLLQKNLSASNALPYFRSNTGVLHVFFQERTGTHYTTEVLCGVTDFISAAGGLLGLGFGFSFISAMEICYFVCKRVLMVKYNRQRPAEIEQPRLFTARTANQDSSSSLSLINAPIDLNSRGSM